ncbi:MAG: hypothetical protein QM737_03960 [Ferruginibacter sp.]
MKVFLSWSGERSHNVGKLFNEWLPQVLQYTKPWLSSRDIDAGSIWDIELQKSLETTNVGIVCLTKENKEKPWILFESGALSKGLTLSRVFTFLIDLRTDDLLSNPLSKFNHTINTKDSLLKLLQSINKIADEKTALSDDVLKRVFEKNYKDFENELLSILKDDIKIENKPVGREEALLTEILQTVREIDKNVRDNQAPDLLTPNGLKNLSYKGLLTNLYADENQKRWQLLMPDDDTNK